MFDKVLRKAAVVFLQAEVCHDEELIAFRKRTCEACDRLKDGKCTLCNCYYDFKAETLVNITLSGGFETTHCPIGKWGDQETADYYSH